MPPEWWSEREGTKIRRGRNRRLVPCSMKGKKKRGVIRFYVAAVRRSSRQRPQAPKERERSAQAAAYLKRYHTSKVFSRTKEKSGKTSSAEDERTNVPITLCFAGTWKESVSSKWSTHEYQRQRGGKKPGKSAPMSSSSIKKTEWKGGMPTKHLSAQARSSEGVEILFHPARKQKKNSGIVLKNRGIG